MLDSGRKPQAPHLKVANRQLVQPETVRSLLVWIVGAIRQVVISKHQINKYSSQVKEINQVIRLRTFLSCDSSHQTSSRTKSIGKIVRNK